MAKFYAQIDANSICIGISQLSGEVDKADMITIESLDSDLIWRKYENGQWSAEKFEPQTTAPLTEFEQIKVNQLEMQNAINFILGL